MLEKSDLFKCYAACHDLIVKDQLLSLIKQLQPNFKESKKDTKVYYEEYMLRMLLDNKTCEAAALSIRAKCEVILEARGSQLLQNNADFSKIYETRTSISVTKELITSLFEAKDADITIHKMEISLLCSLTRKRICTPARGKNCKHLQCFDRDAYLEVQNACSEALWKCPICRSHVPLTDVVIDEYFFNVLNSVSDDVITVEVTSDAQWTPVNPPEKKSQSDHSLIDLCSSQEGLLSQKSSAPLDNSDKISGLNPKTLGSKSCQEDTSSNARKSPSNEPIAMEHSHILCAPSLSSASTDSCGKSIGRKSPNSSVP